MSVPLSRKQKSQSEDFTQLLASVQGKGTSRDRVRTHRQEAETPDSVKGRRLNAQVQEERKGDFGGRLFYRVKKQAHYPTSPCGPQAAGTAP